jgi:site-specific DNA recombinase
MMHRDLAGLVARARAVAKRRFAMVWSELFPAEQVRIVQLLVERVDVREDALEVRIRAEGLASLVAELRQQDERRAA